MPRAFEVATGTRLEAPARMGWRAMPDPKTAGPASLRLLHVLDTVDPRSGGPIEGLRQAHRVLLPRGVWSDVVTLDRPGADFLKDFPIPVHPLGEAHWSDGIAPTFRYSGRLAPWIAEHAGRYDCVVVHGIWSYHTLAAAKALRGSRTPYVVFTHGMLDPWFKRAYPLKHLKKQLYWTFLLGRALQGAARVLFTSEEERRLARESFAGYAGFRDGMARYGTGDVGGDPARQIEAFRTLVRQLGGNRYLLFLGRLHPKKGCDLLVQAFAAIAASRPDLHLVVAGPDDTGWRGALEGMARTAGIADRIHWPGMVGGDAKWGAFRDAEAFVLPSHQENFGVAVAEALACGTPVLISDKVNIWREIEEAGAGYVAPDDLAGTTELLRRFAATGETELAGMRRRARQVFLDRFDAEKTAWDLVAVAREVSNRVDP